MRRRRALAVAITAATAAVALAIIAGGLGAARTALADVTPRPGRVQTPPPEFTIPPILQFTLPPDQNNDNNAQTPLATPAPTPPPTPPPTETPLPTTQPVPTGPAVGSQVTPPGLVSVPVAAVGPAPQPGASDVTFVILIVIIGLSLLAIGAFVLALAVQ